MLSSYTLRLMGTAILARIVSLIWLFICLQQPIWSYLKIYLQCLKLKVLQPLVTLPAKHVTSHDPLNFISHFISCNTRWCNFSVKFIDCDRACEQTLCAHCIPLEESNPKPQCQHIHSTESTLDYATKLSSYYLSFCVSIYKSEMPFIAVSF